MQGREYLADVVSRLDDVREAAELLRVHPRELAERVLLDWDQARLRADIAREFGDGPPTARRDAELAYRASRELKRRARALAHGYSSWH